MKKNNKGFLLAETLVVSTFCLTVLVILFLQFKTLVVNYNTSFKYNTVEGIYNLGTIKKYFQKNNITFSDPAYVYNGSNNTYASGCDSFCQEVVKASEIKTLIYTKSTIVNSNLKGTGLQNNSQLSQGMKNFISQLKDNNRGNRLIAEFNDGTYASITY